MKLSKDTPLESQGSHAGFAPEPAKHLKQDKHLPYLDIHRHPGKFNDQKLKGLRVVVIGAGPAGLIFARSASALGANILVLEQAGDPRGTDPGYTDRSFNITLDNVGRQVLGDKRAYEGGIWLSGRAIHDMKDQKNVTYGDYADSSDAYYVSIPRPVLRQNLATLAEEAGAKIKFRSRVTGANCTTGVVTYADKTGRLVRASSDLIVFGDGIHSLADELTDNKTSDFTKVWPEKRTCFTAMIPPEHAEHLSLNHIHFWHEPAKDSYTIGIPNADGSVALLLTSSFSDIEPDVHPFVTSKVAEERLKRDFPRIYKEAPFLADQLPGRRRGNFWYKLASSYLIGEKGVIVGDAGCVVPPWAGYGANTAMYAAASLAFQIAENRDDICHGLDVYETQQLSIARILMKFVFDQGDFLSGEVAKNPSGRSEASLAPMIKVARQDFANASPRFATKSS